MRVRPAIVFSGPLTDYSGYAEEGRLLITGLKALGFPVHVRPVDDTHRPVPVPEEFAGVLSSVGDVTDPALTIAHYPWPHFPTDASHVAWRTTFETASVPEAWAQTARSVDQLWVPSTFNIRAFSNAGVSVDKLRLLPEPIDMKKFRPREGVTRKRIPFVFLSVFSWQVRKGWDVLVDAYAAEFSADERVVLLLKVSPFGRDEAFCPKRHIDKRLQGVRKPPRIEVIERPMLASEMPRLYAEADAFVLPSRGEGWGRPYVEAMASEVPVIATKWGGHLDFMKDDETYLVDCHPVKVTSAAVREWPWFEGQEWVEPDVDSLRSLMREVFEDRHGARRRAAKARHRISSNYSSAAVFATLSSLVDEVLAGSSHSNGGSSSGVDAPSP